MKPKRLWTGSQFKTTAASKGQEAKRGYGPARKVWDQYICIPCDIEFNSHYRSCPYCGKALSFRSEI